MNRQWVLSAAALVGALWTCGWSIGCTTTERTVRVVARGGAFRDGVVVPTAAETAPRIVAGPDVLTDDELAGLEARVAQQLPSLVVSESVRAVTDPVAVTSILRSGVLTATRLRVRASAGREQHRTIAECRVQITVGDDVIADAEGTALRVVQARNVSLLELPAIEQQMRAQGGRHPLLDVRDTEAALVAACQAAVAAVVDDTRPSDAELDAASARGVARMGRREARSERRRRALARLQQGTSAAPRRDDLVAAALVELGESGGIHDAPVVRPFVDDAHPLVQRASRSALRALCAGHAVLPAAEGGNERCALPPVASPPPPAAATLSPGAHELSGAWKPTTTTPTPPSLPTDGVVPVPRDDTEEEDDDDSSIRERASSAESAGP